MCLSILESTIAALWSYIKDEIEFDLQDCAEMFNFITILVLLAYSVQASQTISIRNSSLIVMGPTTQSLPTEINKNIYCNRDPEIKYQPDVCNCLWKLRSALDQDESHIAYVALLVAEISLAFLIVGKIFQLCWMSTTSIKSWLSELGLPSCMLIINTISLTLIIVDERRIKEILGNGNTYEDYHECEKETQEVVDQDQFVSSQVQNLIALNVALSCFEHQLIRNWLNKFPYEAFVPAAPLLFLGGLVLPALISGTIMVKDEGGKYIKLEDSFFQLWDREIGLTSDEEIFLWNCLVGLFFTCLLFVCITIFMQLDVIQENQMKEEDIRLLDDHLQEIQDRLSLETPEAQFMQKYAEKSSRIAENRTEMFQKKYSLQ